MVTVMKGASAVRYGTAAIAYLLAMVLFPLGATIAVQPALAQNAYPQPNFPTSAVESLRPGDVVRLRIWREPDLSGDFPVSESGIVVFPRLGPVSVIDESAISLQTRLVAAYSEFLNHASIDVILLRRVQVLGAVRNPGLYQVDPTMTMSDVVALAGGATPKGNPQRVTLIREGRKLSGFVTYQTPIGASPVRSGDQIVVPERNWLAQNPGVAVGAVSAVIAFFRLIH